MGRGTGTGGWLGGCRQSWRKAAVPAVRVLCITTVIPAKAGIQRGGARAVHAESHHRDIAPNGCAKNPVRVICTTSQTTDSRSGHVHHPVALPLWIPAFAGMTYFCKDLE